MPHISILFPFVAADQLARAAELLAPALAATAPFQITFNDIGIFTHSTTSHTFWLRPQTPTATEIAQLHTTVHDLFNLDGGSSGRPFCPHLTLGQTKGHAPNTAALASSLPSFTPGCPFVCTRLFLLARSSADDPFHVRHVVPLGGGSSIGCDVMYTAHSDAYWLDAGSGLQSMKTP